MADPILEFDPAGEASGSPLTVTTGNYGLEAFSAPAPPPRFQWAQSVDTEGAALASRGHENRVISISLSVLTEQALYDLQQKLSKVSREGGTLKYTTTSGLVVTYDVLAQEGYDYTFDHAWVLGGLTTASFSLPCKPYGRGAEVDLGDNTTTTLPYLEIVEASIPGDVPALGRLVIDEDDADDQWWLTWGLESRYYSSSANAALFYEAEGRTALGGSAIAAGPSGASGAGSNVMRNTSLTTTYQAILSTQATGGGAHLSHIGTFRAYARVQIPTSNAGYVSVAFEWGEGDFRTTTRNTTVPVYPSYATGGAAVSGDGPVAWGGTWQLLDLGLVSPKQVTAGTQRWEGRILAKSTVVGDDIDVDWLMFVPTAEGSGVVSALVPTAAATSFSARDEFNQAAGALAGKVAAVGGTWAGGGDPDDFAIDTTGDTAQRTAVSDPSSGRIAWVPTSLTTTVVQADVKTPDVNTHSMGVVARVVDASNYMLCYLAWGFYPALMVQKVIAGVVTTLAWHTVPQPLTNTYYTVKFFVDAGGRWAAGYGVQSLGVTQPMARGQDSVLATGGTLASGYTGIFDYYGDSGASTRNIDNYVAWAPVADAAVFASQSLEIRSDRVRREDSGGTLWVKPVYEGDYLHIPPTGPEARTARLIVKGSRNVPGNGPDSAIDDISARLFVTPRFLVLPDPSP